MDKQDTLNKYKEININNRIKSEECEIPKWNDRQEDFRLYREEWMRADNEDYLPSHPLHVDIELSDACNLKCKMCAHGLGYVKNPGFMDWDLAKKIISNCSEIGVYSIKFNWRGEVILHKRLPEAVKYAKDLGILEVQINTNGNIPEERKNVLIECAQNGIDRIIFSVDGFSKETYELIRIGGNYEKLLSSIYKLLDWKKSQQSLKPLMRIQMVRTTINAHEVDDYVAYWQKLVDDVRISDVMDRGQGCELSVGDQVTIGRRKCPQPFQRLAVGRNGKVSPCCADWNQEYVVGDVRKNRLEDIWENEKMAYIRNIQRHNMHDNIPICRECYVKESFLWTTKRIELK
jgi:radical SAM protein with 4Fe4S-binding SPASM domain